LPFLVDTNILLRSVELTHPMNPIAQNAIDSLRLSGEQLHIVPQNLIEFWNVFTRPVERNGLGRTPFEAEIEVNRLKRLFPLLLDTPAIYQHWENLAIAYQIVGINVHDARLVAAMIIHGLTHILTFNTDDFKRYSEIVAVNPSEIRF
jgi:predicted nucleic acid-binding protein